MVGDKIIGALRDGGQGGDTLAGTQRPVVIRVGGERAKNSFCPGIDAAILVNQLHGAVIVLCGYFRESAADVLVLRRQVIHGGARDLPATVDPKPAKVAIVIVD